MKLHIVIITEFQSDTVQASQPPELNMYLEAKTRKQVHF